jgi:hypothetical protein
MKYQWGMRNQLGMASNLSHHQQYQNQQKFRLDKGIIV